MKQPRSVGLGIALTLITCGIYGYYWIYCIHEDTQEVCGRPMSVSGGMVILLSVVTCGIYHLYWCYKMGQLMDEAKGAPNSYSGVLYLVLSVLGLSVVSWALMQSEFNRFTTGTDDL